MYFDVENMKWRVTRRPPIAVSLLEARRPFPRAPKSGLLFRSAVGEERFLPMSLLDMPLEKEMTRCDDAMLRSWLSRSIIEPGPA